MQAQPHAREAERVAALRSYGILDTPREADFDDVVKILAEVCDVPFSTITLIDEERQWHKAAFGIGDLRETPRGVAFCSHTILHDKDMLIVPDVTKDARFADNLYVTGDPNLRFYAAALLRTEEGLPLGTVCVVDYKPRQLDARQTNILQLMAKQVMAQIALRREIAERRLAEEKQALLIAELNHRVKNTLAVVQSHVHMSARAAADLPSFRESISARIEALAKTNALLVDQNWERASLRELLATELSAHSETQRVTMSGPEVSLNAQSAVIVGMCLHELMTNAVKYGALSVPAGQVTIAWNVSETAGERRLDVEWTESNGPAVMPPARRGFGSTLLDQLTRQSGG